MSDLYDNLDPVTNPTACCVRDYYKQREAELREKLAELQCENTELMKDAARYRFIRNQAGLPSPEEFDSAVDADMSQPKEPKQ